MEFTITLNSPLTEEDLDTIYDVDMDNTSAVTFHTKHGKEVEFVKVVRCKDCVFGHRFFDVINGVTDSWVECRNPDGLNRDTSEDSFCSYGERKDE